MTTPAGARAKPVRGTRATSVVSSDATTRGDGLGLVGSDRTLISSRITTGRQALADGRGCGGTVRPLRPARRRESGSPGVRSARQRVVQDRAGQGFAAAPALFGALSEPDVRFRRQVANRDAGQDRLLQRSREQWLRAITCSTSLVPARLEVGAQLGIGVVLWNNCCGPPSLDRDDSPSASVIQTPESGSRRRDEARGATRRTLERWPFDCQPDCQPFRLLPAVWRSGGLDARWTPAQGCDRRGELHAQAGRRPPPDGRVSAACCRIRSAGQASRAEGAPPCAGRLPRNGRYPRSRLAAAAPALSGVRSDQRPRSQPPRRRRIAGLHFNGRDTSEPNGSRWPVSRSSRSGLGAELRQVVRQRPVPGRDRDGRLKRRDMLLTQPTSAWLYISVSY